MFTTRRPSTPPAHRAAEPPEGDAPEDHDLGLAHDLPQVLARRRALQVLGLGGLTAVAVACGAGSGSSTATTSTTSTTAVAGGGMGAGPGGGGPGGGGGAPGTAAVEVAEGEIPEETNGPYPADGTNGVNVLTESGIVRSDITSSFGGATGVAEGIPLEVELTVYDLSENAAPLSGAAIYIWHCDRAGLYSMYSQGVEDENYLRGVQEADAQGKVRFTTIFPAAYRGRWPHIHFEVYPTLDDATSASNRMRTSQLAFPEDVCDEVYATAGYEASVANMVETPLANDNVFGDGYSLQMGTMSGSVPDGLTVALNVPV